MMIGLAIVTMFGSASLSTASQDEPTCQEEIDRLVWEAMEICNNWIKNVHITCLVGGRVTDWSFECGGMD